MAKSIFEQIAAREIPAYIIWENEDLVAFLDINPLVVGHTLLTPKQNWGDYLFNLPGDKYSALLTAAKQVAKLLAAKIQCERVLMVVEGFEIDHVHIKLLPASSGFHLTNSSVLPMSKDQLEKVYKQITAGKEAKAVIELMG